MPCYTQRQITLELTAANQELLIQALESIGFKVQQTKGSLSITKGYQTATIRDGQIRVDQSNQAWVGEIKQAYARTAIKVASKRFGWQVTEQKNEQDSFLLQRRFA